MDLTAIKKELHEYIDDADDRILTIIYGMVLADRQGSDAPKWHQEIVQERLETYERNPEDIISWEELKANVEKMR